MRVAIVAAMVMALSVSSALAAGDAAPLTANAPALSANAPLAPAKPAGVDHAQTISNGVWVLLGVGAAIAVLGITMSNGSQHQNFASSTQ